MSRLVTRRRGWSSIGSARCHDFWGGSRSPRDTSRRPWPTHPQPAEVYSDWALLCHRIGQRNRALELAEKALNAAADAGDPVQLSRVHNILGVVTPDSLAAISHLDEAIEHAGDDDLLRMAAL